MYKKNARIASAQEFAAWSRNKSSMKAKGLRMVLEQGNWLLIDLTVSVTDAFWKAWRKDSTALKAKGYRVARVFGSWIVY